MDEYAIKGIEEFHHQSYQLANDYFNLSQSTNQDYHYYFGLSSYYTKDYSKAIGYLYQFNNTKPVSEVLIESFLRINDLDNIIDLYKLNNVDDYINGLTLLFRSVKYRIFEMIARLMRYGASPYKECQSLFKTPLNYTMIYNDFELIEILIFKE